MRATSLPSRRIRAFRSACEAEACLALKLGHSARVCCARIRIVTWLGFGLGFGLGLGYSPVRRVPRQQRKQRLLGRLHLRVGVRLTVRVRGKATATVRARARARARGLG